jgi:hypothetical protein
MQLLSDSDSPAARLANPDEVRAYNVLGPIVEFFTQPAGDDRMPCTMRGTIPPGITVPIHSHADPEIYVAVSGTVEALTRADLRHGAVEVGGVVEGKAARLVNDADPLLDLGIVDPHVVGIVDHDRSCAIGHRGLQRVERRIAVLVDHQGDHLKPGSGGGRAGPDGGD